MMYGELAKQNASYQTGHNTGSLRACGYMQNRFDEIVRENPRKKKYTVQEGLPVKCWRGERGSLWIEYESGHAWQYAETESGLEWFHQQERIYPLFFFVLKKCTSIHAALLLIFSQE